MRDVKTILSLASGHLEKHKIEKPRLMAESLLAHFLGFKRIDLYIHFDRPLVEEELEPFRTALKRAASGEPLEYILGEVEFYHTTLKVTPDVLIPRQETEILLDLVCKRLDGTEKRVLDLCTGSGCLAIGLKKAHPELEVVGVDLSTEALAIAEHNALKNGVEIQWKHGDLTQPVQGQKFDLVLCNPPYVTEEEFASMGDYEPKMALVSGSSGYEFFERLGEALPAVLNPGAKVFFEIGSGQGEGVKKRFFQDIWENLRVEPDWAGHDRFFYLNFKLFSSIM
ncbi:MAG: Release factor glutamine methyltransferase [Chlamydiae bacterium]|nr:Release factor glutamine methyltransferase [Chlamydiota bacterium]